MKLDNLLPSLIVVLLAVFMLAAAGWAISFAFVGTTNDAASSRVAGFEIFFARVIVGLCALGIIEGLYMLWRLFCFCMTAPIKSKSQR